MQLKVITILGARPQFVKAAAISRAIKELNNPNLQEIIVHTGQHFDKNMSQVFFDELGIPEPDYNLHISGGSHGEMTGRMLMAIENVIIEQKPSFVMVYGDTNSTLAGALAAAKLHVPVIHVEAGLRSFNMKMPEEVNRTLVDRISDIHFCTSNLAVENLKREGLFKHVYNVGDVMYDVALLYSSEGYKKDFSFQKLINTSKPYILATCHRAENTNDKVRLENILKALHEIADHLQVVFPLHPRTHKLIEEYNFLHYLDKILVLEPLPYIEMLWLQKGANVIITDSGGIQKEAYFLKVPCVTVRDETEWVETLEGGANKLAGTSAEKIIEYTLKPCNKNAFLENIYGDGKASNQIVDVLTKL